ncbi:unnamed protein product [Paramecium sonneborni]|uniref:Uncharacterized protein n=1 Tax=Paramecium sonneborni TaxID=65129 RepID=A0A8S1RFB4_9CILI|nr:unnamed protein product [Paramecium sonneborni]
MQLRYRDSEITQFIVVIVKKIVQSVIFQHVNNVTLVMQSGFVYACPVHSVNIVDYADIVPIVIQISQNILQYDTKLPLFSKSILQFYMSTSDINQYFDQNTLTGNNFLRGQKFSIFPSKFALDDMEQCNRQKIMDYIQSSLCGYYLIQFYIWR